MRLVEVGKLRPLVEDAGAIEEYLLLCNEAVKRINDRYYPQARGWIGWTREKHPDLWSVIQKAEEELESPLERGVSLGEFSKRLEHWERLLHQAIENFLNHKK